MKIPTILGFTFALGLLAAGVTACVSEKQEHAGLAAQALISRTDAEKIALSKIPGGKVQDAELETEKGTLIWSFDISTAGTKDVTEVHVDANTGAIIAVETESAEAEASERKK